MTTRATDPTSRRVFGMQHIAAAPRLRGSEAHGSTEIDGMMSNMRSQVPATTLRQDPFGIKDECAFRVYWRRFR
jgi:hypothetical protein